jgi:hypothetical protein
MKRKKPTSTTPRPYTTYEGEMLEFIKKIKNIPIKEDR